MKKERSMRPQAILSRSLAVNGFLELLSEQTYETVSISDICERAGISRQTFYRNFDDKDEVITYHIDGLTSGFTEQAEGIMEKDMERFFANLPFTPEFLIQLKKNHRMHLMTGAMVPLIEKFMTTGNYHAGEGSPSSFDPYYARYLAATVISVLDTWAERDFRESTEQLYEIMLRFLRGYREA